MSLRWLSAFASLVAAVAQTPTIAGDYSGALGPLHIKLHLKQAAAGALTCTLDSTDQGALGLPCANLKLEDKALSFDVPSVGGKWHGTVSSDSATLSGSWSQGTEIPLAFQRDGAFLAAEKPSRIDSAWLGSLDAKGIKLRIQLRVKSDRAGKEYCTLDSLDQGAMGLPCENVHSEGDHFSFAIPAVNGKWAGVLSENGNELKGTWSQGSDLPLTLTRQSSALEPEKAKPPAYEGALPAVPISELKAALAQDLAAALDHGALAPATAAGVVIGVIQHGVRQFYVYGPVKQDSLFEIGSISKTFTGLILAQLVEQHQVKFDDPVRELLPAGTVTKPQGPEITLLDLATQHSGLPRMPDNFHPADPRDPYADYRPANLYQFIGKHGVQKSGSPAFGYSNLGVGLLGQALANHANTAYSELLKLEVTQPLGMRDTVVKLSPDQEKRFVPGHDAQHQTAHAWALDALAGAGAIRSTADDMLTYLEAQLHPASVKAASGPPSSTLASALQLSHKLRAEAFPGMQVALAWLYNSTTENYWHNGATGGYSSFAFFNPNEDVAGVVLFNTTISSTGSFADRLGEHIIERLSGKPAVSLAN